MPLLRFLNGNSFFFRPSQPFFSPFVSCQVSVWESIGPQKKLLEAVKNKSWFDWFSHRFSFFSLNQFFLSRQCSLVRFSLNRRCRCCRKQARRRPSFIASLPRVILSLPIRCRGHAYCSPRPLSFLVHRNKKWFMFLVLFDKCQQLHSKLKKLMWAFLYREDWGKKNTKKLVPSSKK